MTTNIEMNSYCLQPVLTCFEYRAEISRYLPAAHQISQGFLACFAHRGCSYGVYYWYSLSLGGTAANFPLTFPWMEVSKAAQEGSDSASQHRQQARNTQSF